jgi:hypothetical protein
MTVGESVTSFQGNLADMTNLLVKMEDDGKVAPYLEPMLQKIKASRQLLEDFQTEIANARLAEPHTNFLAYHLVRNIGLALEKMNSRFLIAQENHDNPVVAEDSLSLIPVMGESFSIAERIMSGELTHANERMIIERVRILRDSMYSGSMLITSEEEASRVSQSGLEEEGRRLVFAVKDLYSEEQQNTSGN